MSLELPLNERRTKYIVFAFRFVKGGAVNLLTLAPLLTDRSLGLVSVARTAAGLWPLVALHSVTLRLDASLLDGHTRAKSISIDSRV